MGLMYLSGGNDLSALPKGICGGFNKHPWRTSKLNIVGDNTPNDCFWIYAKSPEMSSVANFSYVECSGMSINSDF